MRLLVDVYFGGNFLLTVRNDDGNLDHIASLAVYDPDKNTFDDAFDGGVFSKSGYINLMAETPL